MKKLTHKSNQKGFTIIEVLIVLAIAGLIMLVVFLAVPALNRNSHNSQKKSDISALIGGVNEYAASHNGAGPTAADVVTANAKLSILDATKVFYQGTVASAPTTVSAITVAASATALNVDSALIVKGATCAADNTAVAASSRSYVVLYALEAASGNGTLQCTASS